ncbi:4-vinyl reductase [Trichlorobacter lovleyi]|uniref:4-vinyl reductase n=1 Tax=Trichlorobacter lovleyi TaxID=313985 RepID=UPI00223EF8C7|nr:4-vinyl reductase [Trichlorobacter lovleyi]QOX80570.1 4-vinyl reductase [Trichlorobacter lovleyi]
MSDSQCNHPFSWELLGDLAVGRPSLGPQVRVEAYRLMQFTLREVLERHYGTTVTDSLLYESGYLAGKHFYDQLVGPVADLHLFSKRLGQALRDLGIGILAIEEADLIDGRFVVTVSEDLDCSGLPVLDNSICTYDEGFISALLESYSGRPFVVREVDCWANGARTCRFVATACEV